MRHQKRIFRDAPPHLRCCARVALADGSFAQCGRYYRDGYFVWKVCTQHGVMLMAGKVVIEFCSNDWLDPTGSRKPDRSGRAPSGQGEK